MTTPTSSYVSLTCPACHTSYRQEVPTFIRTDVDEKLVRRAREGDIHRLVCPNGHSVDATLPLLVHQPGHQPSFVCFLTPHDTEEVVVELVYACRDILGPAWGDARSGGVWLLPPLLLRAALGDGFDAAATIYRDRIGEPLPVVQVPTPDVRASQLRQQCGLQILAYQRTGDARCLDTAVACGEQAARLAQPGSAGLASALGNLGAAYLERFDAAGVRSDLDSGVAAFRSAVDLRPRDAGTWNNLSAALTKLVRIDTKPDDLKDAIVAAERAVNLTPEGSEDLPGFLDTLCTALLRLDDAARSPALLDRAVDVARRALALRAPATPDRAGTLNNLSAALRNRHDSSGALSDVEEAIACAREAGALTPPTSPYRRLYWNQLGRGLEARYYRLKNSADLREAVECWSHALDATAPNSPAAVNYLNNLGIGFLELYRHAGDPGDLERAIDCSRQVIAVGAAGTFAYNGLGNTLMERYRRDHRPADLEEAVAVQREGLAAAETGSATRATLLNNLGLSLLERYGLYGHEADRVDACAAFQWACEEGASVSQEEALRSSYNWGSFLFDREEWHEAARAFSYGLEAIDRLVGVQLTGTAKSAWLRPIGDFHVIAAYAAARSGDLAGAIAALEQGRARLLAEALERARRDLDSLHERGESPLWERFRAASASIAALPDAGVQPGRIDAVRREWAAVIEAVRRVPGLEDFLKMPDLRQIQRQLAESGALALIYVLTTGHGGLALVVGHDSVEPVWGRFTQPDLASLLSRRAPDGRIEGFLPAQLGEMPLTAELDRVLARTGEQLVAPIAACLRAMHAEEPMPLVWLVPFGGLSLLPLHAATYEVDGIRRALLDEFTVAWVPSARVLARCRDLAAARQPVRTLLAVGNPLPQDPSDQPLAFAAMEAEAVAQTFGAGASVLRDELATLSAITDRLATSGCLHFACHGVFEPFAPLDSGLLMAHGERLTVSALLDQAVSQARLAILSACETAISDVSDLPDELVGLPSAFLHAGVPGVIGTFWSVDDVSTALLMIHVHQLWKARPDASPARVLRDAQVWLRELSRAEALEQLEAHTSGMNDRPDEARASPPPDAAGEMRPFAHPFYWAAFACFGA